MSTEDPRSDTQLVAAANAGDAAAFDTLYHRYRDWAARLAFRFTRDEADALDVVQDAFLYLLGKFPGFELRARLTTFLYPTIKHLAIRRRQQRQRSLGITTAPEDLTTPPTTADAPPSDLHRLLAALPEPLREMLLMRFLDDMPLAEIAAALDIPLGTVKSRLHHALATLRADPALRRYFES